MFAVSDLKPGDIICGLTSFDELKGTLFIVLKTPDHIPGYIDIVSLRTSRIKKLFCFNLKDAFEFYRKVC